MQANTTGASNTGLGDVALYGNISGSFNTAVGENALQGNTTGAANTGLGRQALSTNTTGYDNTAVGYTALNGVTTGYSNTSIGKGAGSLITTGASNTIVGRFDGNQSSIDIRTLSSNIVLSDGAGNVAQVRWGGDSRTYFLSDVRPWSDNAYDLGGASNRWDDVYATNGTIQTSDEREKQNITSLTSAEITAATAISKLFKTFKWKDNVAVKGDDARTHTGVIAQQVQSAMSDAGLDASKYAFWCSDTWWEKDVEVAAVEADDTVDPPIEAKDAYTRTDRYDIKDEAPEGATEHTRLGIRYPDLLSFIGAATEQRLTSIESRLTALEAG